MAILVTTAARNSSVRLLWDGDVDFERSVIRFRRAKGGKTLEVALQPGTATALSAYLEQGRPALLGTSGRDRGNEPGADPGWLFLSGRAGEPRPLTMNALSLPPPAAITRVAAACATSGATASATPRRRSL